MKIAFDMQPVLDNTKSGVGYHETGLVNGLLRHFPEEQYIFQYFSFKNKKGKEKIVGQYQNKAGKCIQDSCSCFPGSIYRILSAFLPVPYVWFFSKKADITHFFNFIIPPGVYGKKVVTIHDMAFRVYPETVRLKTKVFLNVAIRKSIRRADHIITVSEFSKNELIRFYKIPEKKISVVPNGVDLEKFRSDFTEEEKKRVKEKYGIQTEHFFLFLGNVEPRKNIVRLIKAYRMYCMSEQTVPAELVIAGGKGWLNEEIFQEAEFKDNKGNVRFTGYVEDEDVPVLMAEADAFCFPSLYEGFGMPVLEAMACGTPVIAAASSSLPEVVGDAGILVNPYSEEEMADAMRQIMKSDELRKKYSMLGLERVKSFTWEKSVEGLYEVYRKLD